MSSSLTLEQFDQFQQLMRMGITEGSPGPALDIMKFLRHAAAPTVEMTVFEAWQLIGAGQLPEARQLLEDAARVDPANCELKALLATTLFFSEDDLWHQYAREVEQAPQADDEARGTVERLKAAAESGLEVDYLRALMLWPQPAAAVAANA